MEGKSFYILQQYSVWVVPAPGRDRNQQKGKEAEERAVAEHFCPPPPLDFGHGAQLRWQIKRDTGEQYELCQSHSLLFYVHLIPLTFHSSLATSLLMKLFWSSEAFGGFCMTTKLGNLFCFFDLGALVSNAFPN